MSGSGVAPAMAEALLKRQYVALHLVGTGLMARVFRGYYQTSPSYHVAIKVMRYNKHRHQWRREVACMKKLQPLKSPNLPRLLDSFTFDQISPKTKRTTVYCAIITPYYSGGTLRDIIWQHGALPQLAAQMIIQLIPALAKVHALGIAHCDIKLDNILMTDTSPRAKPVLCDWGLCEMEKPRECCGTRGTMTFAAPELIDRMIEYAERKKRKETTAAPFVFDAMAADTWAMGVTILALYVGKNPFTSKAMDHIRERIKHPESVVRDSFRLIESESAKKVLLQLLDKDPKQRCIIISKDK